MKIRNYVLGGVLFLSLGGIASADNTIVAPNSGTDPAVVQNCNNTNDCNTIITLPNTPVDVDEVCNGNCIIVISDKTPVPQTPVPTPKPTIIPQTPIPTVEPTPPPEPTQIPQPTEVPATVVPPFVNTEVCDDEVDNDSDGFVDEDCNVAGAARVKRTKAPRVSALPSTGTGLKEDNTCSVFVTSLTAVGAAASAGIYFWSVKKENLNGQ